MTTAPQPPGGSRPSLVGPVVRAALVRSLLVTLGLGVLAVAVAAATTGAPGAVGAGVGVAMVCLFFGGGALVLAVVSALSPAASLLVALLTYTLQVVLVGLVFVGLSRSGALGREVDPGWLAGTLIGGTTAWLAAQVLAHTKGRQPVYDLPSEGPQAGTR
jgi:ATP synthase protein I